MNDIKALVKSWVNSNEEFSVDFDLLWQGLGYSQKGHALEAFKTAGFSLDGDFRVISETRKNLVGGRPTVKYHLTVDCAKSFCMMARTDTGKQVRFYFIECERQLKIALQQPTRTLSFVENLELANAALTRQINQCRNTANKPGLANIIEQYSQPNMLDAAKATVQEIASTVYGVDLEPGEVMSLGRLCAGTYRAWHNTEPEKEQQLLNGSLRSVAVYGVEMYTTIENWLTNKGYEI